MKIRILLAVIAVLAFAGAAVVLMRPNQTPTANLESATRPSAHTHPESAKPLAPRVPAFQQVAEIGTLPPTLAAAQFFGKTREAYDVAKKIPTTLAQIPCYCECDRGLGHKSLHSCFVDDHASHCAVCVDEALLAYKLQREEKLSPEQVRARIIDKYSTQ